jgi:calcium-dependent protein kinase
MITNIDYLGNGQINYSEFLAATIQSKLQIKEEHLWTVFKKFDTDDTGFISEDNLETVMRNAGKQLSRDAIHDMIKEVDFKNDGQISFEEFKIMMLPTEASIM